MEKAEVKQEDWRNKMDIPLERRNKMDIPLEGRNKMEIPLEEAKENITASMR